MDIYIRGVNDDVGVVLNKIAKKKGVTRNKLIKEYLTHLSEEEQFRSKQDSIDYTISKISNAFKHTQERIDDIEENIKDILILFSITADIDIDTLYEVIDKKRGELNA